MNDSILLVNKPKGISSARAVDLIKKTFRVKAGHAGTLDPSASGLLIILTGAKTKEASSFLKMPKAYEVDAVLGMTTDTYDTEGRVLKRNDRAVSAEELRNALKEFKGEILQTPPPFSAKKIGGKKAYELARKGKAVPLAPQKVHVYSLELVRFEYPEYTLCVRVSSGFYVRSLVHDIGKKLGVGATAREIRRLQIGDFTIENALPLDDIVKN